MCAYADEPTYNFFDPADCDADGWLWLDSQYKIDKYVGVLSSDKKIKLVPAEYVIEDPDYPGEEMAVVPTADPNIKGYNKMGTQGGEGSKTGGISLPMGVEGWLDDDLGGGILVAMPDCFLFEVYMSQSVPKIFTYLKGALFETNIPSDCYYIWDWGYDWWTDDYIPLSTDYVTSDDLTVYVYEKEGSVLEGTETEYYMVSGEKGCGGRTAYYANNGFETDLIIHGLRIFTYTDVSDANVEGVAADDLNVSFDGKCVKATVPVEISVYDLCGAKVAGTNGTSLDCSALNGVYLVKAGNKALKVVL